jgi:cell wall assembly regulator SMI1
MEKRTEKIALNMENSFVNLAKSITIQEFEELENYLGNKLPEEFKSHYLKYNGGFPVNDRYYMKDYDTYTSINGFMPIKHKYDNNDNPTLEQTYEHFNKKGVLPLNLLAFAADYGGNKFCIDLKSKNIFLIYMDLGNPMENSSAIRKISESFQLFIDSLEEAEEEEV